MRASWVTGSRLNSGTAPATVSGKNRVNATGASREGLDEMPTSPETGPGPDRASRRGFFVQLACGDAGTGDSMTFRTALIAALAAAPSFSYADAPATTGPSEFDPVVVT